MRHADAPTAAGGWRRALVMVVIVAQVAVPAVLLAAGEAASGRFGWQMYARPGEVPVSAQVERAGDRPAREVDLDTVLNRRREMTADDIAAAVCRHVPHATTVILDPDDGADRWPC